MDARDPPNPSQCVLASAHVFRSVTAIAPRRGGWGGGLGGGGEGGGGVGGGGNVGGGGGAGGRNWQSTGSSLSQLRTVGSVGFLQIRNFRLLFMK